MRPRPRPPRGFFMVEFLLAATVLAVVLLGLTALETATVRGLARARARQTALALAGNALEAAGPDLARFDLDGRPAGEGPAFFTVTVTRCAPAGAGLVRASVAWAPDGRVTLTRLARP